MSGFATFAVGEPWPYPGRIDGMKAILGAGDEGLDLMLAVGCDKPTAGELKALRTGPMRLAVWPRGPLTWIVLDAGVISCDAPYARGIASAEHSAAIEAAAAATIGQPETARGIVTIAVVDRGRIAALRVVSLSRAWWRELATSVAASPAALDRRAYDAAVVSTIAATTTPQMLKGASIVEAAGRV